MFRKSYLDLTRQGKCNRKKIMKRLLRNCENNINLLEAISDRSNVQPITAEHVTFEKPVSSNSDTINVQPVRR